MRKFLVVNKFNQRLRMIGSISKTDNKVTETNIKELKEEYEKLSKEDLIQVLIDSKISTEFSKKQKKKIKTVNQSREINFDKYSKRKIALKISYEGWNYSGFAAQEDIDNLNYKNVFELEFKNKNSNIIKTVEGEIFKALLKCKLIMDPKSCDYARAGRTDAGVSGCGQVISLFVRSNTQQQGLDNDPLSIDIDGQNQPIEFPYVDMLNRTLPPDIRILGWSPVKNDFSARFHCRFRRYKYFFVNDPSTPLDINLMRLACSKLIGAHDFRFMCNWNTSNKVENYKRVVYEAQINLVKIIPDMKPELFNIESISSLNKEIPQLYEFDILANAFIYNQIRCIMGLLFLIGRKKEDSTIIDKLLDIENIEGKPLYQIAEPEPLILFETKYTMSYELNWQSGGYNAKHLPFSKAYHVLFKNWYEELSKCFIKSQILNSIQSDLTWNPRFSPDPDETNVLVKGNGVKFYNKKYVEVLNRPRSYSLEGFNKKHEKRHQKNKNSMDN